MKRRMIQVAKIACATTLALAIAVSVQRMPNVYAGSSNVIVDNASFAKKLDENKWNVPNDDVLVKDGKIIFTEESSGETRIITKGAATKTGYHDELFSASYKMKLKTLPKGEKFFVAFGLETPESYYEESGNLEITFENNGGLQVGLNAFEEEGTPIVLAKAKSGVASLNSDISISVTVTADMKLTVKVNNQILYNKKSPIELEGRMGFLMTGACEAEVSDVDIVFHEYDRPENVNIVEDFESGSINTNTLTSYMNSGIGYFPAGVSVQDYRGSKVLMFQNVGMGYIGTKQRYSNFELTFDIPYLLYKDIKNEEGEIQSPANLSLVVSFGDESIEYDTWGYDLTAAEAIVFYPSELCRLKGDTKSVGFADKGYYDAENNVGYSVKMRMIDGQMTVYLKSIQSEKYDEVYSYKVSNSTPLGYIHIWSSGRGNFAIDNLKVTNMDNDANVKEVDYKPFIIENTEDWEYQPQEAVYLEQTNDNGFNWKLLVAGEVLAGAVVFAICMVVAKTVKKGKKREVPGDEA